MSTVNYVAFVPPLCALLVTHLCNDCLINLIGDKVCDVDYSRVCACFCLPVAITSIDMFFLHILWSYL